MDSDYRQICIRVISNHLGWKAAAIRERHFNFGGVMHNVAIRKNVTIPCENEARAVALYLRSEALIIPPATCYLPLDIDIYNRWADFIYHTDDSLRIGIEKLLVRSRGARLRRAVPSAELAWSLLGLRGRTLSHQVRSPR